MTRKMVIDALMRQLEGNAEELQRARALYDLTPLCQLWCKHLMRVWIPAQPTVKPQPSVYKKPRMVNQDTERNKIKRLIKEVSTLKVTYAIPKKKVISTEAFSDVLLYESTVIRVIQNSPTSLYVETVDKNRVLKLVNKYNYQGEIEWL